MKIALSFLLLISGYVHAVDLSETTTAGSKLFEQAVSVSGEAGGDEAKDIEAPWAWSLDYALVKSKASNSDGTTVTDHTHAFSADGSYRDASGFGLGGDIQFSNTKEEKLVSSGGTMTPSYFWEYNKAPGAKGFSPYLEFKLDVGRINYRQSFEGQRRLRSGPTVPAVGATEINQSLLGFDLSWRPLHDWRFGLGTEHYTYDRDVTKFQNSLDSPQGLRRGLSGFANTVGGMPRVTYSAKIVWYLARDWKNTIAEQYAIAAADHSVSSTLKDSVEYHFAPEWRVSVGAKQEKSSSTTNVLGILGLEWDGD